MAKKTVKQEPPQEIQQEPIKAIPVNQAEEVAFGILDEIFHKNEDNWNTLQDDLLLNLIENENGVNDKIKIKYLFKKYRDEARENHGQ